MGRRLRKAEPATPAEGLEEALKESVEAPKQDPFVEGIEKRGRRKSSAAATDAVRAAGIEAPARSSDVGELPELGAPYGAIVETVLRLEDPEEALNLLLHELSLGSLEYSTIAQALDLAEDRALLAHRLYTNAKLVEARFVRDAEVVESALWAQATASLQEEKDRGTRAKQITDKDVQMRCQQLFPEQWGELQDRRLRAKLAVEHLAQLPERWAGKCRDLGALLAKKRGEV